MRSPRAWSYVTYLFLAPFVLGGCPAPPAATGTATDTSTDTQTDTSGTTTGQCPIGASGCPCTQGGVCDLGLVCAPDQTCVPDATTTGPGTSTTGSTTEAPGTTTSDVSSTGPTTACDPADGQPNLDCMQIDPLQPYCADAGVCGGCTVLPVEQGCAQLDPNKPLCNADDGLCVACNADNDDLCTGNKPACNLVTNQCEGCFEHSHCPIGACDILKRECFPDDKLLLIRTGLAKDGECTDQVPLGGSVDNPYCTANLAIAHAQFDGPTSGWVFKFIETNAPFYHPSVSTGSPGAAVSYAFIHVNPGPAKSATSFYHSQFRAADPVFTVGADVTAYIHNFGIQSLNVQNETGIGIGCLEGGTVYLDDSYVRDARGSGILADGCDVYMRRSSVFKGKTEGINLRCAGHHCELHMVNSYVTGNLYFQGEGGGGITAENATLDILYSTILDNNNEPDPDAMARGDSIHCIGDFVDGAIRNSVIARKQSGNLLSIKCSAMLSVSTSLVDSDQFKRGNYKTASETILGWFDNDSDTGARLVNENAMDADIPLLSTLATWKLGDPRWDYGGDARPTKDGAPDFPGADRLPDE